jgi:hypothetical protein
MGWRLDEKYANDQIKEQPGVSTVYGYFLARHAQTQRCFHGQTVHFLCCSEFVNPSVMCGDERETVETLLHQLADVDQRLLSPCKISSL